MKLLPSRGVAISISILMIGLAGIELALRYRLDVPILAWRDWRGASVTILQTGGARYDEQLGWTQVENVRSDGFNTLRFGIRKNDAGDSELPSNAVLAVGDSYTAGSEVKDPETWPAQLERKLGTRVINAGVGGYGVDQAVLNALRLLPVLKPRAVIVGIYEEDVLRSGYRSYTAPKPFFVKKNGEWKLENQPVPHAPPAQSEAWYRDALSHSIIAHMTFQSLARDWWHSIGSRRFERAENDPAEASCHALERLSRKLAEAAIPGLVVAQFPGWTYSRAKPRDPQMQTVLICARDLNFAVVDESDYLNPIARRSVDELKQYYVMSNGGASYGHMSAKGNRAIAELIAPAVSTLLEKNGRSSKNDPAADKGQVPN